ncbi:TPA: DUF2089 domain-containing protein [Candidatus Poribacteria bacterium]|nr:DUF2089 domain-containing protein [Candidatus Poribacteria bacterium]HEX29255.1 DUF2089 domain-containing protein [Candidatus Poribacteria bacterium]
MKSFKCPSCGGEMVIKRLACTKCDTVVEGTFTLGPLSRLSTETASFIEMFVKNRGNMRRVSQELGVSYPTARKQLEKVVRELEQVLAGEKTEG